MISYRNVFKGLLVSLTLCISLKALPWGFEGHAAVSIVAMEYLLSNGNPEVTEAISNILNNTPGGKFRGTHINAAMVASFADDMRSNPKFDPIKILHFVNIPADVKDYESYKGKDPKGDLVVAIQALGRYLNSGNIEEINEVPAFVELQQNKVKMNKEIALKLFVHFWSDLFQPLHLGYPEDAGGNKIDVIMIGRNTNLHSALDQILAPHLTSPKEYAETLINLASNKNRATAKKQTLLEAVNITLKVREEFYKFTEFKTMKAKPDPDADPNKPIDPTAPTTRQVPILGYEYQFKARRILEMQMVRAGLMMANALEQIFTPAKASGPNYFTQRKSPGRCESMFGG